MYVRYNMNLLVTAPDRLLSEASIYYQLALHLLATKGLLVVMAGTWKGTPSDP